MADLSNLLQLGQQMQFRLSEIQSQLAQQTVTCTAGGGIVAATADGRGQIRAIKIDPQAIAQGDVEMLEDLVLAAGAQAQDRKRTRLNSSHSQKSYAVFCLKKKK